VFHAAAIMRHQGGSFIEGLSTGAVDGAPALAEPRGLLPNLAVLALLSLWVLARHLDANEQPQRSVSPSRAPR
jgi:hypothetical protein